MKSLNESQIKPRRQQDAALKMEAVRNWLSSGKTAEVVAREFNRGVSSLTQSLRRATQRSVKFIRWLPGMPCNRDSLKAPP